MSEVIPAEAVEAAAKVVLDNSSLRSICQNAAPEWRGAYRDALIAALEAAAPFIEQAAYDRGFDDGHLAGQESMEAE